MTASPVPIGYPVPRLQIIPVGTRWAGFLDNSWSIGPDETGSLYVQDDLGTAGLTGNSAIQMTGFATILPSNASVAFGGAETVTVDAFGPGTDLAWTVEVTYFSFVLDAQGHVLTHFLGTWVSPTQQDIERNRSTGVIESQGYFTNTNALNTPPWPLGDGWEPFTGTQPVWSGGSGGENQGGGGQSQGSGSAGSGSAVSSSSGFEAYPPFSPNMYATARARSEATVFRRPRSR